MSQTIGCLVLVGFFSTAAWGQKFDAASIKPVPDPESVIAAGKMVHMGTTIDDSRVDIGSAPLKQLIALAYKVQGYQIECPAWMNSSPPRFDVLAAIPAGATRQQVPEMMQALLAERFHLTLHRETKEQPVYALVIGKSGPRLTTAPTDIEDDRRMNTGPFGPYKLSMANGVLHYEYSRMTMPSLAAFLSQGQVGMQVIDMTGLSGAWQVSVDIGGMRPVTAPGTAVPDSGAAQGQSTPGQSTPGQSTPGQSTPGQSTPSASDPSDNSIFTSLQRLGLNLEKRRAPLEQLVVDHADKMPTEN